MGKGLALQEVYVSHPVLRVDAVLRWLCRMMAAAGGVILSCVTLVTVASVLGRALFNTPVPGDFELVEMGVAISVSFFLPYCQIQEGNVIVDIFTANAPQWVIRTLGAVGDLMLFLISALMCWRLVHGCLEYREYEEVTMVLQIPLWWGVVPIIVAFALLALTCATTMLSHLLAPKQAKQGRVEKGAEEIDDEPRFSALSRSEIQQ